MLEQNLKIISEQYPQAEEKLKFFLGVGISDIRREYRKKGTKIESESSSIILKIDEGLEGKFNQSAGSSLYLSIEKVIRKIIKSEILTILSYSKLNYSESERLCESLTTQIVPHAMDCLEKVLILDEMIAKKNSPNYNPCWKDIKEKYSVAVSQFYNMVKHYLKIIDWTITLLQKDQKKLLKIFKQKSLVISEMEINLGDSHHFGKAVVMIETAHFKFILKPRSTQNEEILSQFLKVLNRNFSKNIDIAIPKFLGFEEHSWHQYIDYKDCESKEDVYQFYYNIGSVICWMYALNGTDIHFENIIAKGKVPYIVDLECIFNKIKIDRAPLENSVINSYITPPLAGQAGEPQICGIGVINEEQKVIGTPTFIRKSMGDYQMKKNISTVPNYYNRPNYKKDIDTEKIKANIIEGFEDTWHILKEKKVQEELFNIVVQYDSITIRKLHRATKDYGSILNIANHPRYLTNFYDRKVIISCITYLKNKDEQILKAEFASLMSGFIPYFTEHLSSSELKKRIKESISRLDSDDEFNLQKNILSFSLEYLYPKPSNKISVDLPISHEVRKIQDIFIQRSLKYKNKVLLLNSENVKESLKSLKVMNTSLYNGKGSILFLRLCCEIIDGHLFENSQKIKNYFFELYNEEMKNDLENYGVFEGRGSLLYLSYLLFKFVDKNIYYEFKYILDSIIEKVKHEEHPSIDIMSGLSGVLIVCFRMWKMNQTNHYLIEIIEYLVNRITSQSVLTPKGVSWNKQFTGFSHGNSGVIYSLCLANEALSDPKIVKVIEGALLYEKKNRVSSGWNDLRYAASSEDFNAWCHGAQGIMLSREAILNETSLLPQKIIEMIKFDINHYHKTDLARKENKGYSLCHGKTAELILNKNIEELNKLLYKNILDIKDISEDKMIMTGKLGLYYATMLTECSILPNVLLLE